MDPHDVAPMVVAVTLFVVTGGVLVLRPLTRRLGDLIQLMIDERRGVKKQPQAIETERVVDLLENLETRLSRLEERQSYTDALLSEGTGQRAARLDDPGR